MAANQGLYNGFLAAGLTSSRKILFVQTAPALAVLALVLLAR